EFAIRPSCLFVRSFSATMAFPRYVTGVCTMAPRATWKGYIMLAELAFPVSLYAGATTYKRISFHIINRKTGNRVSREYIDEDTEEAVDREHQVKGYETGEGEYIILQPEEIAAALPDNDKTISIDNFVPCADVDTVFFDKPY